MGGVGCLIGLPGLSVFCMVFLVAQVYLVRVIKIHGNKYGLQSVLNWVLTSGFGWEVLLGLYIYNSGPCTFYLSIGTWYMLSLCHSYCHYCFSIYILSITLCVDSLFVFQYYPSFHWYDWWLCVNTLWLNLGQCTHHRAINWCTWLLSGAELSSMGKQ